jgi:hypothetical protein
MDKKVEIIEGILLHFTAMMVQHGLLILHLVGV